MSLELFNKAILEAHPTAVFPRAFPSVCTQTRIHDTGTHVRDFVNSKASACQPTRSVRLEEDVGARNERPELLAVGQTIQIELRSPFPPRRVDVQIRKGRQVGRGDP